MNLDRLEALLAEMEATGRCVVLAMADNAERMRRLRERRVRGMKVIPVEVDVDLVDDLVTGGWLARADADVPAKLALAVGMLLAEIAAAGKKVGDASRGPRRAALHSRIGGGDDVETKV